MSTPYPHQNVGRHGQQPPQSTQYQQAPQPQYVQQNYQDPTYQQGYQETQNAYYPPQGNYPYAQPEPPKKKKPILKWILGAIATLVLLLFVAVACTGSDSSNTTNSPTSPDASSGNQEADPQESATDPNAPLAIGQTFTTKDGLAVTVTDFFPHSDEFSGEYRCANIDLANTGNKEIKFSGYWDWKFQSPSGVITDMDITASIDNGLQSGALTPGGRVTGAVCTDLTKPGAYQIVYDPELSFSSETARWNVVI